MEYAQGHTQGRPLPKQACPEGEQNPETEPDSTAGPVIVYPIEQREMGQNHAGGKAIQEEPCAVCGAERRINNEEKTYEQPTRISGRNV